MTGWLFTIAIVLFSAFAWQSQAESEQSNKTVDEIRTRRLKVVDEKGAARVVIAAPVPDGLADGERQERRAAAYGVQINDQNGNERGGFGMLSDGSMVFGADDEKGNERAHLFYVPSIGAGLVLQDDKGNDNIRLIIPNTNKEQKPDANKTQK